MDPLWSDDRRDDGACLGTAKPLRATLQSGPCAWHVASEASSPLTFAATPSIASPASSAGGPHSCRYAARHTDPNHHTSSCFALGHQGSPGRLADVEQSLSRRIPSRRMGRRASPDGGYGGICSVAHRGCYPLLLALLAWDQSRRHSARLCSTSASFAKNRPHSTLRWRGVALCPPRQNCLILTPGDVIWRHEHRMRKAGETKLRRPSARQWARATGKQPTR